MDNDFMRNECHGHDCEKYEEVEKSCNNCEYREFELGDMVEVWGVKTCSPDTIYCTNPKYFNENTDIESVDIIEQTNWGANCGKWQMGNA
jgi:hypothetical protein